MSTKLTYTGAEVQELLDKIEKGDFDNAKTLEGHPASYFAIASEFTSLAESFATEQGRINTLYSYFNNGSANDALRLGGQLPSYYATATQYEILQRTLSDFKSLFDSMFEKDSDGNIHAKLSLWSSGGITAGGVGSGSTGGGGASYDRLDSWADYSADKAGYVLSALLGKDLDDRVSALANAGYITASYLAPYALRSEIPSLVGYATESWVTSQGYITQSALTPYFLTSNFTKANIKSTLGIVDSASFALVDAQGVMEIGKFIDFHTTDEGVGVDYSLRVECQGGYRNRVYFPTVSGTIALTSNIPTKLSQLTDDVVAGNYLSKSGGRLVYSGAQGLEAERTDGAPSHIMFIGVVNGISRQLGGFGMNGYNDPVYVNPNGIRHKVLTAENYTDYALSKYGGTVNGSITATSFIGNLTGNADSATKLATPRTIWGQPFDGTGDITGDIMFAGSNKIAWHNDKKNYYISSTTTSTSAYLEYNAYGGHSFLGGNVAIGGTTASEKLHVHGNGKFTGALTTTVINTNTLKVGNITLVEENGALKVIGGLIATGGVTSGEKAS